MSRDLVGITQPELQAALRRSEERYRHLVEHASDIIYSCDVTGRFTFVNPVAARLLGYREEELVGSHFLKLIHPDFRAQAEAFYLRQIRERISTTYFEFPAIAKDGREIWFGQNVQLVLAGEAIVGVDAIARDITASKCSQEAVRASEARYRSLINGAVYGIYRSTLDGRFVDANPALAALLGYDSVEELLRVDVSRDVYQDPLARSALVSRYQSGYFEVEAEWKRRDGTPLTVRLSGRVLVGADGAPDGFEAIVEDLTERRDLENQLRRSQKLEAIARLAGGVAHDFNNILMTVMGTSELLLARLPPGNPQREELEEIIAAAERGAKLTRQLLAFSRQQRAEPQEIDLGSVVSGLDVMLGRLIGPEIGLQIVRGPTSRVLADPGQIEQVIMNLVINARDAMPEGGQLIIEATSVEFDERAAHARGLSRPGLYGLLVVSDTGSGMDEETSARLFEPFYTTKDPTKGTGLGLSIVYGIVRESGGSICFASEMGYGSTFRVYLPALDIASVSASPASSGIY